MEGELAKQRLQPPTYGDLITILSIDGGGIRGVIPGTILAFLESELQVGTIYFNDVYIYKYNIKNSKLHSTYVEVQKANFCPFLFINYDTLCANFLYICYCCFTEAGW